MFSLSTAKRFLQRKYWQLFLKLMALVEKRSVVVSLRSGQFLEVRVNDQLALEILNGESFEKSFRDKIFTSTKNGMVVLDIGGNIGYYTVELAKLVGNTGRVIAFEPNPVMLNELRRNVSLNQLQNVLIEPIALSSRSGEAEFHCAPLGWEGHGSLRPNELFHTVDRIQVKTHRLDDILQELGIVKVDLIKMDVEGAERSIFQGAQKLLSTDHKPLIYFECAESTCRAFGHCILDVLRDLSAYGYHIVQIDYGIWFARPKGPCQADIKRQQ